MGEKRAFVEKMSIGLSFDGYIKAIICYSCLIGKGHKSYSFYTRSNEYWTLNNRSGIQIGVVVFFRA